MHTGERTSTHTHHHTKKIREHTHHAASNRITYEFTTPPHTTPPHRTAPYRTVPYHTIPYHTIPHNTTQTPRTPTHPHTQVEKGLMWLADIGLRVVTTTYRDMFVFLLGMVTTVETSCCYQCALSRCWNFCCKDVFLVAVEHIGMLTPKWSRVP